MGVANHRRAGACRCGGLPRTVGLRDETTQAALENGYVYDEPGEGTDDQVAISGDYALVVDPHLGYWPTRQDAAQLHSDRAELEALLRRPAS